MAHPTRLHLAIAACGVATLMVSGCSGSTPSGKQSAPHAGGTLYVLNGPQAPTWDPQRINIDQQLDFSGRVFSRTLTAYSAQTPGGGPPKLVGDLATNTGAVSDGGRVWKFVLRQGPKWQDGKPVTCADVKYGISRVFASGQIVGGFPFPQTDLDIPTDANGASRYKGPYTKAGQALYDHAVSCAGRQITFRLKTPMSDFNQQVALQTFAPYRKDKDTGAKGVFSIFSDGPYMLKGSWTTNKGGTFVRNPYWKAASDPVRKAYPNQIVYEEGLDGSTIGERLIDDSGNDQYAVSQDGMATPVIIRMERDPALKARMTDPESPYVEYLAPNFRSPVMKNPLARKAFAMSTNRGVYATALGGPTINSPAFNIFAKNMPAYSSFRPFGAPANGDPVAAKKVLQSSGLHLPVPITVTYMKGTDADKGFAAMAQTWDKAGFKVTLDGISQNYYDAIASPTMATKSDVFWSVWGAFWPSGSSVIPPMFDGRINISSLGSGDDPGYFNDPKINRQMDAAAAILDPVAREKAWGKISEEIADEGGYVGLNAYRFFSLYGSGVKNITVNRSGSVDLAAIAVR